MAIQPDGAINVCARIVEAATKTCSAPTAIPTPPPAPPNWDAMANSFAALSTAFVWGSILLAILAVIAGLAWGKLVTINAENEARTEAQKCARSTIDNWLAEEAPLLIRAHVEFLRNTSLGSDDDDKAADAIGKAAG